VPWSSARKKLIHNDATQRRSIDCSRNSCRMRYFCHTELSEITQAEKIKSLLSNNRAKTLKLCTHSRPPVFENQALPSSSLSYCFSLARRVQLLILPLKLMFRRGRRIRLGESRGPPLFEPSLKVERDTVHHQISGFVAPVSSS
jgi:hypothetical protein